jgi:hypothetical protein
MNLNNKIKNLPNDIQILIYSFDITYKEYFSNRILPSIITKYLIFWTDKITGNTGFDLTGISQYKFPNTFEKEETDFPLHICKKICKINNFKYKNYVFTPFKI